jgi:DNA polymerase-3 subunit gamma/tau
VSQALYRRYRPETFGEVIGQEQVTGPLMAALGRDRVNHAYLFSGPRGCGKTTSARILARCLNCAQGPTATPCGECESCRDLARGGPGSLDVVEIDAASHGGVDDARTLRERAVFAPARDRYKVFIIDEAHMVSPQGFNALLKIVEEPPPHVRFVFATTEPDKVIGTIRSRTHHYPFRLVPPDRLTGYLAEVCEAEGATVAEGVLPLVVRAGGGSVRDSLSVLDQLIGGAGDDGLDHALAVSLLGFTDAALLDDFVDGLAAGDGAITFTVIDRVVGTGIDPRRFVEDLLQRLRDLIVVAAVPDGAHTVLRAVPPDQLTRMADQSGRFGRAELSRAADVVNTALTEMSGATSPRMHLELLCARLLLPGADPTDRGLSVRLDRLEQRLTTGAPAPAPSAAPRPAPATRAADPAPGTVEPVPSAEPGPAPGEGGTVPIHQRWASILDTLSGIRRSTWSLVSQHATPVDFDGERLLLAFPTQGLINSFTRGPHQEYLRQAVSRALSLDCRIETTTDTAVATRPAAPVPPEEAGTPSAPSSPDQEQRPGGRAPATSTSRAPWRTAGSSTTSPATSARQMDRVRLTDKDLDDIPPPDEPMPEDDPGPVHDTPPAYRASGVTRPRETVPNPQDDQPSADDPDMEGSSLVGPPVIEKLLGGRVIEERSE